MSNKPTKPGKEDQPTDAQRFQAERDEAKHIKELKEQAMGGPAAQKHFEEMKKQVAGDSAVKLAEISRSEKMRSDTTEANRLIAAHQVRTDDEAKQSEELKKRAIGESTALRQFEELKKKISGDEAGKHFEEMKKRFAGDSAQVEKLRIDQMQADPTEANRLIAAQLRAGLDSVSDKFDIADAIPNIPLVNNPLAPIRDQLKRIEEKLDGLIKTLLTNGLIR